MNLVIKDLGTIEFQEAYRLQEELVESKAGGVETDFLLLAEHPHVYTTGRGGDPANLPRSADREISAVPIFRINRGGDATYHGPGQIVVYPLIGLEGNGLDVDSYLRRLESVLIETLAGFNIAGAAHPGRTGVWIGNSKIACIGIGVRKGVTMHGFSLNVNTDLDYFKHINPCGLTDARMTSLQTECGGRVCIAEVKIKLILQLRSILVGSKYRRREVLDTSGPAAPLKSTI